MNYCRYCGAPLKSDYIFCRSCGHKVENTYTAPFVGAEQTNVIQPEQLVGISGLIKCPDCGKEISKRASSCPNCGCPIVSNNGVVTIKLPCLGSPFFSQNVQIVDDSNRIVLWTGRQGEIAKFNINNPTQITIFFSGSKLTSGIQNINGMVFANKRYVCTQDHGMHMFATYHLSEVDVIDA